MPQTAHRYVVSIPAILGGEPIIEATRTPVRAIVEPWRSGVPAEEITLDLPHLTLAQVFDALSYYSDHSDEINSHIEANRRVLVTYNRRDFELLVQEYCAGGRPHAGLIAAVRRPPRGFTLRMLSLLNRHTADEFVNQVFYR